MSGHSYTPGEGAFREPLIDSEFKRTNPVTTDKYLFTLESNPSLLIRKGERASPEQGDEIAAQHEQYTRGLMRLDEEYGLHSPGISVNRETQPDGDIQWYIVANRVHGTPFANSLSEVPQDIACSTFDKILDYYSDMATKTGIYLMDITLPQMVYGTQGDETKPKVYMVDRESESSANFTGTSSDSYMLRHAAYWLDKMMWQNVTLLGKAYGEKLDPKKVRGWIERAKKIERSLEDRAQELSQA